MRKKNRLILSILLLTLSNPTFAGKLYKWVDKNGKVSFSDKVPPEESKREREELNEEGRIIAVKDAAKTPEEIQRLKEINHLQALQKELLQSQLAKDSALLKTFRTEEDIDTLANSKLEMLNSHITIATSQSETLKKQLILHQAAAANFERSGKKIPQKNLSNIQSAQAQFDKNQQEIADFKLQKTQLSEQLANDKLRFNVLKTHSVETPTIDSETIPSLVLGQLTCDANTCKTLWDKASSFITDAGTTIVYRSDELILTRTPRLSKDIGLSLTKVNNKAELNIMLDIRCANSKGGKATCKSEQTAQLIEQFNQLTP
ncbi:MULTISPECIES: DUF4124 domain-containing protein [Cycloclasticus]|jgi:hypothetical protein|uniref:DUF4124 domain-containing protein n=1 Tax=Cycloclasticus TaxID=34067 RepID=UPI0009174B91|nr:MULTISPECIES: DUF4124 domain-containing protein [Cycloclasticus]PHR50874.1 MAG: DUF4124 domain-containing protein [Cycloclasticus sp.]SHI64901.1 protein of unknown function [Cycloclasticus pugetii]